MSSVPSESAAGNAASLPLAHYSESILTGPGKEVNPQEGVIDLGSE